VAWRNIHSWCRFFRPRGIVSSSGHINDLIPPVSEGTRYMPDDGYDNLTALVPASPGEKKRPQRAELRPLGGVPDGGRDTPH
jgi:hypothetical protein